MSLKYHFQHIKNKTLKNVVFFTFHGTQNETIIFKNQTITIKEQRFFIFLCAGRCRWHGVFTPYHVKNSSKIGDDQFHVKTYSMKTIYYMIWKLWLSCNIPACPFPPMPLFRARTLVQGLLPMHETLVTWVKINVFFAKQSFGEWSYFKQNLDS